MAHVTQIQNKNNINIFCPDGFSNQLRLALAGVYLKMQGYVHSYNMEWSINNHNNVNFLDYFLPLPKITFNNINHNEVNEENIVHTASFKAMIECLSKKEDKVNWEEALNFSLKFLKPRKEIKEFLDLYVEKNSIRNCLGLHIRRTCKTAILDNSTDIYRLKDSMLSNEEILNLATNYEKVFLATDNRETQKWFEKNLKHKLITFASITKGEELFNREYDRDLVMRYTTPLHTVMDFLVLTQCNSFLGTSESSLSLLIKHIRNNSNDYPILGRL